ncbi:MAG: type II toxin-antitoxin system VapC family toxin [Clostridiales Family XIII bacterium]|jgi:PIN domain nuclease of toxin-antitoxin system|nr:type II toxin-antitoxin system VapC family toxin [Clostridiales Family XIII bacterium]
MEPLRRYLLDTHTFLWAVQEDKKLSSTARQIIEDVDNELFLSSISAFEIANKYRIGKLPDYEYIVDNYPYIVLKLQAQELQVNTAHAFFAAKFEWAHRDPFDRILVSQASIEDMPIITNDAEIASLNWIETIW